MMQQDPNTWLLARLLLEENGLGALHNARKAAENLLDAGYDGNSADVVRIVYAMDLLLTDDADGTFH